MSTHTIAAARDDLSALIDRALAGEAVMISRDGQPVVTLQPLQPARPPMSAVDIAWLDALRVQTSPRADDAGTLVSRMRDEDWR
jgi:antitoxin (DNA-binding transcriptional repressor) of toxin-antitoxin stability system